MFRMTSTSKYHARGRLFSFAIASILIAAGSTAASAQSSGRCDAYARDVANARTNTAGNVIGGAAVGAVGGAIIGGIINGGRGAGRGAAIGGGIGAVGGAAQTSQDWRYHYNVAYNNCMRGAAQNTYRAVSRPAPWSDEWYSYCSAKYRSFNPADGTYQPYGGPRRLCQ